MFIDFTVRFIWFFVKVVASCLFVIILQLQVGEKSLEQILDQTLKESVLGVYFQNLTKTGAEMVGNNIKNWVSGEEERTIATPATESPPQPVEYTETLPSSSDVSIPPSPAP